MFNSREYEWADITLLVGGRDIQGIRGVKFGEKAEREPMFAKGRYAHSIQTGNVSVEGEFVLTHSAVSILKRSSRGGSLLNLSVDAIVNFGDPSEGNAMQTYRIIGARFLEDVIDYKQGDKFAEITVPWVALRTELIV